MPIHRWCQIAALLTRFCLGGLDPEAERRFVTKNPPMDSIRLKFAYSLPAGSQFFKEQVLGKNIDPTSSNGKRYVYTNNTWRREQQNQRIYVPKYWIEEDYCGNSTYFVIELSLPKLLFGESITELEDHHFEQCVEALALFLKKIDVHIFKRQIMDAVPTLIALCKNINLTKLCTTDLAIRALSPFDYKPHNQFRVTEFSDLKSRGKEIIFTVPKVETFKIYSKTQEIMNNAETEREIAIASALNAKRYQTPDGIYVNEILRAELTLKTPRKVESRFRLCLPPGQRPTFENIFKKDLWDHLLRVEMSQIYDHPLKRFVFLSQENKPVIDAFLDKNHQHIETKDTMRGIIGSLQEFGLAKTRQNYLDKYNSRQTWYNYTERLEALEKHTDFSSLESITNYQIYSFILRQFGIDTRQQSQLDLNSMSKKLDTERRNTREGLL